MMRFEQLSEADPCQLGWAEVGTVTDIYTFMTVTMTDALFSTESFDNRDDSVEPRNFLGSNIFLGDVRFGLLRVNREPCSLSPAMTSSYDYM